jgi:hypothetical protein
MNRQEFWEDVFLRGIGTGWSFETTLERADEATKLHGERFGADAFPPVIFNPTISNQDNIENTKVFKPSGVPHDEPIEWGINEDMPQLDHYYEIAPALRKMLIEKDNEAMIKAFGALSIEQLDKIIYCCKEVMRPER